MKQSTEAEYYLRFVLSEMMAKFPLPGRIEYRCAADFVLRHGNTFRGEWTSEYEVGAQRQCYGNSIMLAAVHGLSYVEGFALAPNGVMFHHGWNATPDGTLLDSTWANTGLAYIGVVFSVERGDDATWNKDAHVLNDVAPNELFIKQWKGEDFTIEWPYSDRLAILRSKNPAERIARYVEWARANEQYARAR